LSEKTSSSFSDELPQDNVVVVSHRKDADGLSSAALIHYLTNARIFLTDYSEMNDTIFQVPESASDVYICDLGLNKNTFDGFIKQVERLGKSKVHYIDHHHLNDEFASKLRNSGVDVFHSEEECASVLIYKKFEERLRQSSHMKVLACCGAITDYMDFQPFAKKLISSFDRQFLLYEATVLAFSIAIIGRGEIESNLRLEQMAEELGKGKKFPHEIENASSFSQEFASRATALLERARNEGKKMQHFAYIKTNESSTGNVAYSLVGAFDTSVGVAFREDGSNHYEISLRSTEASKDDLGKIITKISSKLGASGGGHFHAAGCRIERSQLDDFVKLLDQELSAS
jgi:oligoribonuclease NrnB/cAMP/cGMP phosphodiesterase (DHH superfamily)